MRLLFGHDVSWMRLEEARDRSVLLYFVVCDSLVSTLNKDDAWFNVRYLISRSLISFGAPGLMPKTRGYETSMNSPDALHLEDRPVMSAS